MPTSSSSRPASPRSKFGAEPQRLNSCLPCEISATCTFSRTVMVGEGRRDLEGAPDAEPPDLARLLAGGVLAEQADVAGIGPVLAVEHVEAGALARAVRTDQRQDFAGAQRERDAAHGVDAAIGFGQAFDREKWGCDAHSADSIGLASKGDPGGDDFLRRCASISSMPTMPLGKTTTISTMKPPSTSFDRSVWLTSQMFSAL